MKRTKISLIFLIAMLLCTFLLPAGALAADYYVTYSDGGNLFASPSIGVPGPASYSEGTSIPIPLYSGTREGFRLNGWMVEDPFDDPVLYLNGAGAFVLKAANTSLTLDWTEITYIITYDDNNPDAVVPMPDSQESGYWTDATLSDSVPTRDDLLYFAGWNTQADGQGENYQPEDTYADNADVTLYAQWTSAIDGNITSGTLTSDELMAPLDLASGNHIVTIKHSPGFLFANEGTSPYDELKDYQAGVFSGDTLDGLFELDLYLDGVIQNEAELSSETTVEIPYAAVDDDLPYRVAHLNYDSMIPGGSQIELLDATIVTGGLQFVLDSMSPFMIMSDFEYTRIDTTMEFAVSDVTVNAGDSYEIYATLTGTSISDPSFPIFGATVSFYDDGELIGIATTDTNGKATLVIAAAEQGSHIYSVSFTGKYDKDEVYYYKAVSYEHTPFLVLAMLSYPVTFNANHGIYSDLTASFSINVPTGTKVMQPDYTDYLSHYNYTYAEPTRVGYTFNGWYTNATVSVTNAFDFNNTNITKPTAIYAGWKADTIAFQTATGAHKWVGKGIYMDYFQEELYTVFANGITQANASTDVTYAVLGTNDLLPAGLFLDANSGVIYGVPTVSGEFAIDIRVTNSGVGATDGAQYANTTVTIVIENRDITFDADGTPKSKIYGQNDPVYNGDYFAVTVTNGNIGGVTDGTTDAKTVTVTYTYSSKYVGDTQTPADYIDTFTLNMSRGVGETVGQYKLYLNRAGIVSPIPNYYDITIAPDLAADTIREATAELPGTAAVYLLTINQRDLQIEAAKDGAFGNVTKIYGEDDSIGHRVTPSDYFEREKDATVSGDYDLATWSVIDINGNNTNLYDVLGGKLYRMAGESVGDYELAVGYLPDFGIQSFPGAGYNHTVTITDNSVDRHENYNFLSNSAGALTISQRPITVNAVIDTTTKIYGEDDPLRVQTVNSALVNRTATNPVPNPVFDVFGRQTDITDTLSGNFGREAGEDVDDYRTNLGSINTLNTALEPAGNSSENYALTNGSPTFTITKKSISLSARFTTRDVPAEGVIGYGYFTTAGLVKRTVTDVNGNGTLIDDLLTDGSYTTLNNAVIAGTYRLSDFTLVETPYLFAEPSFMLLGPRSTISVQVGERGEHTANYFQVTNATVTITNPTSGGGGGGGGATDEYTIAASAGSHGSMDPIGKTTVEEGDNQTFTINADSGYEIADVMVDGVSVGSVSRYTFVKLAKNHTISATFKTSLKESFYVDVQENDWFYSAVKYVDFHDLMTGNTPTTFSPQMETSRGMLVSVLWRLAGKAVPETENPFSDISSSDYYAEAVAWAYENGIVTGVSETIFDPNSDLSREQMAAMLYRYAEYKGYNLTASAELSQFTDADQISAYALDAMKWAFANDLIMGRTETTLEPGAKITRAEVASIMMRFAENVK